MMMAMATATMTTIIPMIAGDVDGHTSDIAPQSHFG
jgi:hypothetical protein